jgi:hypothetical protein
MGIPRARVLADFRIRFFIMVQSALNYPKFSQYDPLPGLRVRYLDFFWSCGSPEIGENQSCSDFFVKQPRKNPVGFFLGSSLWLFWRW